MRELARRAEAGFLAALAGLGACGCSGPTDEQVTAAFLHDHPTFTVTSVQPGEGDANTVYMHVRFRRLGSPTECEVVWGYQEAQPEWVVFYKGQPSLAGTVCEGCTKQPCPET